MAKPASRLVALDALRAIAVVLVLGRHLVNVDREIPPLLASVLTAWRSFGWMGVDLFFVLSGFLVSGLLFAEYRDRGELRPWRFLGRRAFKIYPGFYFLLVVSWFWVGTSQNAPLFLREALFVQNYLGFVWNHTWSLAVEEHFYFGLAALLWFIARFGAKPNPFEGLPKLALLVFTVVFSLRVQQFAEFPYGYLLLPTHFRIDALLFGTVLAYYATFHHERFATWIRRFRWRIGVASAVLLVPCVLLPLENGFIVNTVGLTTNYLGFGGLVALAATAEGPRLSSWLVSSLAWLGRHSYSVYLWHSAVSMLTAAFLPRFIGWPASIAAYLVGSIVVGVIAGKAIEFPFLRLRERLLSSSASARP